jgi:sugar phosphate isomerase/epimerase
VAPDRRRVGLSSFTYPWAVGMPGEPAPQPLTHDDLLDRAVELGVPVVQIADNLPLDHLTRAELQRLRGRADERGLELEVGTRGIAADVVEGHLAIAVALGSPILRVVVDRGGHEPSPAEVVATLRPHEPAFRRAGVTLAIENHDRLPSAVLAAVVEELGTGWVGICLDTVNSLGALEGPDVVVATLGPLAVNVHVKDFAVERIGSNLGFDVRGRPVGGGRLDLDRLFAAVPPDRPVTAVVELWTPRQADVAATVELERRWAEQSVRHLTDWLRSRAVPPLPQMTGAR